MNGISEKEFINLCKRLHQGISNMESDNEKKNGIDTQLISILSTVTQIIDESNGFINTDNEEIKELFHNVFSICRSIKQNFYLTSHYKSQMQSIMTKNPDNEKELADACYMYAISQKQLTHAYDAAMKMTEAVYNMGNTK